MAAYSLSAEPESFDNDLFLGEDDHDDSYLLNDGDAFAGDGKSFPHARPFTDLHSQAGSGVLPGSGGPDFSLDLGPPQETQQSFASFSEDSAWRSRGAQREQSVPFGEPPSSVQQGDRGSAFFQGEEDHFFSARAEKATVSSSRRFPEAREKKSLLDPSAPVHVITGYEQFCAVQEARTERKGNVLREPETEVAAQPAQHWFGDQRRGEAESDFVALREKGGAKKEMRCMATGRREETGETCASPRRNNEEFVDICFSGEDSERGALSPWSRGEGNSRGSQSRGDAGSRRGVYTLARQDPSGDEHEAGARCNSPRSFGDLPLSSPQRTPDEENYPTQGHCEDEERMCLQPGTRSARDNRLSPRAQLSPRCTYTPATSSPSETSVVESVSKSIPSGQKYREKEGRKARSLEANESCSSVFSVAGESSNFSARSMLLGRQESHLGTGSRCTPSRRSGEPFSFLSSLLPCREALQIVANRLYYSRFTAWLYLFVFLLNAWVLVRCLTLSVVDLWVVCAEVFVTLMLLLEVCLRALVVGRPFFFRFENIFDIAITVLCVALLCISDDLWGSLAGRDRPPPEEVDDIFRQSLTAFRFSTQLLRMVTIVLHQKRSKLPADDIDFSYLEAQAREPHDDGL
ncbi:conserved hypothetical protein [Neospora caninum Liverpool]|uniref:Transmembrane protein n=1 Tax=Neospora caninum (strain Liverpool) TaxID=572307 RepID=F0VQA3_NEOCL|nr:conserved hypothetical protein [Neospora caninum Liverpool]CBZ55900.1 conserved hypothetical protein [Neospora caninum Liverpool]CEL70643.1 TPA: hypothetical protein BN1204_063260 [Neospora caninum Liverpool]|eukprot:XP_003885926.1 conserved hypothetical protein [Neospora caninum Liverpool]